MGLPPLTFTGVSSFSNDFQSILSRAVSIAQLPITALQNQQSDILQEKQLTTNLESAVSQLNTSVTNLGNLGSSAALVGSSSDTTKVVVNSVSSSTPASYAITNISSVASEASESTLQGYADATTAQVSSTGTVRLVIGGKAVTPDIQLDSAHNNLNGLRDAINAMGAGVTAAVISTGTGATPEYLSVSANSTGQADIQLVDDPTGNAPTQLLTNTNPGANAVFDVNGAQVTSQTNVINSVVPGMVFTIAGTTSPNQTVTLSTQSDPSELSNALQSFVSSYNAVASQLDAQIGPAAGLLSGNSLIWGVQNALRGLVNYNGSGAIQSLTDLGIELDDTGKMSFNQNTFNSLSSSQIGAAFSFLGSATTGFGGLSASISQYSDPLTGAIKAQEDSYDSSYNELNDQVTALTQQLSTMQATLTSKLQLADSQVAQLQSQQSLLNASIQALNFASYGYNNTPPSGGSSSSGA